MGFFFTTAKNNVKKNSHSISGVEIYRIALFIFEIHDVCIIVKLSLCIIF